MSSDNAKWAGVQAAIDAYPGTAGVSLLTSDGDEFGHNQNKLCSAASVIKIPLMAEVFRQRDAGTYSLDDIRPVNAEDKAVGSGVLKGFHDGVETTIHDLLYVMMSISDNTATNMLIDLAGMDNVNKLIRDMGHEGTVLVRKMQGRPASGEQKENYCVPRELALMIRDILNGSAAPAKSCMQMVELLKSQANRARLARPLGDNDSIEFGSKTGTIKGVCNDAGFYRAGDRWMVLSVFLTETTSTPEAEATIGSIAAAALNAAEFSV